MNLDKFNPEWQLAVWLAKNTNQSFFLTGKAGTGKSTLIKHLLETVDKKFIVVAPTGVAALNVGGVTIHSMFGLPIDALKPRDPKINPLSISNPKLNVLKSVDTIIIDEVSMVRADLLDAIDWSLRINTGNLTDRFGGKQIILCGDIFQLPPVVRQLDRHFVSRSYQPEFYFFDSIVLGRYDLPKIELRKVYRQTDQAFIEFLDKLRDNTLTDEEINSFNAATSLKESDKLIGWRVILTTTKNTADWVNQDRLGKLKGVTKIYQAKISGDFPEKIYPTNYELRLKIGAQVVLLRNDSLSRWVNGTTGYIEEMDDDNVKVRLKDQTVQTITPCDWENNGYKTNDENGSTEKYKKGVFTQLPIKLAWAMTIHKSQGLTFDNVYVDLGNNSFASGQTYVALSRARSQEGLRLGRPLKRQDIIVDKRLNNFTHDYNCPKVIKRLIEGRDTKEIDMFLNHLL